MSGLNLQLSALTLPEGQEFPGTPQALLTLFAEYLAIIGGEDFSGVAYGDTEPPADQRGLAWFRTNGGGEPIGWYGWDGAAWSPLPVIVPSGITGERPSPATIGQEYYDTTIGVLLIYNGSAWITAAGSSGDLKFVTGTDLSDVLAKNPGWSHYEDGIGRTFIGALADGSDAEDDIGADSIVLTEDQMPEHTHEDIILTGSDADNGDAGNFVITAATASIGTRTIAASQTGPKGGSDPVSVVQSSRVLFCLVKD